MHGLMQRSAGSVLELLLECILECTMYTWLYTILYTDCIQYTLDVHGLYTGLYTVPLAVHYCTWDCIQGSSDTDVLQMCTRTVHQMSTGVTLGILLKKNWKQAPAFLLLFSLKVQVDTISQFFNFKIPKILKINLLAFHYKQRVTDS